VNENIRCFSTRGRTGFEISNAQIATALFPHGICPHALFGVYWHQAMDSVFVRALNDGVEWIMTIDGDTMPTAAHVSVLLAEIKHVKNIDCLCALQAQRGDERPLASWDWENVTQGGKLQPADQAHFGLTFLRTEALKTVATPWFFSQPDENGHYTGSERLDADIWFWKQWRAAGHNIWIDRECNVGHLDESVIGYRDNAMYRKGVWDWQAEEQLNGVSKR
jgi:hypothetical protein